MLSLASWTYGKIAEARNALYDRGIFEVHDLGVPTVSIGNLTTGGTGKTPLAAYVAEMLARRGDKVCILTRGYGRDRPGERVLVSDGEVILDDPRTTGDEPLELARKLKGKAIIISDADRVSAGEWARRKFGVTAFVLDDGFQHRQVKRDVDIVCIDATAPFKDARMLPAGRFREPLSSLSRATAAVITRSDLVGRDVISHLRAEISKLNPRLAIFQALNKLGDVSNADLPAYAFCGLANPETFYETLRRNGLTVTGTRAFADHHRYKQNDLAAVEAAARQCGAGMLVTTAKDAVKLADLNFEMPLSVARIELEIDDPERFASLI